MPKADGNSPNYGHEVSGVANNQSGVHRGKACSVIEYLAHELFFKTPMVVAPRGCGLVGERSAADNEFNRQPDVFATFRERPAADVDVKAPDPLECRSSVSHVATRAEPSHCVGEHVVDSFETLDA